MHKWHEQVKLVTNEKPGDEFAELQRGCRMPFFFKHQDLRCQKQLHHKNMMNMDTVLSSYHSATKGSCDQTGLNTSNTDRANKRLVIASIYLPQYGFAVYHIAGKINLEPDALSRLKATQDGERTDEPAVLDEVWFNSDNLTHVESEAIIDTHENPFPWASMPPVQINSQPAGEVHRDDTGQINPGYNEINAHPTIRDLMLRQKKLHTWISAA